MTLTKVSFLALSQLWRTSNNMLWGESLSPNVMMLFCLNQYQELKLLLRWLESQESLIQKGWISSPGVTP